MTQRPRVARGGQAGQSLLEVMIAIVVMALLGTAAAGGLFTLFRSSSQIGRQQLAQISANSAAQAIPYLGYVNTRNAARATPHMPDFCDDIAGAEYYNANSQYRDIQVYTDLLTTYLTNYGSGLVGTLPSNAKIAVTNVEYYCALSGRSGDNSSTYGPNQWASKAPSCLASQPYQNLATQRITVTVSWGYGKCTTTSGVTTCEGTVKADATVVRQK